METDSLSLKGVLGNRSTLLYSVPYYNIGEPYNIGSEKKSRRKMMLMMAMFGLARSKVLTTPHRSGPQLIITRPLKSTSAPCQRTCSDHRMMDLFVEPVEISLSYNALR